MIKAAVIGYPIKHSLSPQIHNYWFSKHNIEGVYEKIEVAPEALADALNSLQEKGYKGCNVTLPHKTACMEHLDEITPLARQVGAVNTIIFSDNGKRIGTNTDVAGFINNIKQHYPDISFAGKSACVLGAGGAARAVCVGLIEEGIKTVYLTNRTKEKAQILKEVSHDIIQIIDWEKKESCYPNIEFLVNTTSLGMTGQPSLNTDLSLLTQDVLVTDIVYNPLKTKILEEADKKGLKVVTGLGMLLHQAAPAFEAWTGQMVEVTDTLEDRVIKAMEPS